MVLFWNKWRKEVGWGLMALLTKIRVILHLKWRKKTKGGQLTQVHLENGY